MTGSSNRKISEGGRLLALRRMLGGLEEAVVRRFVGNAGWLLGSSGIASALAFLAGVLAARSLGLGTFGNLALVMAYVGTVSTLVSFQSWQAIVKYGSVARRAGRVEALRKLFRFGYCLDIGTSILGVAISIGLSRPLASLLGWHESVGSMAIVYSWLIFFSFNGTSHGILRLYSRFDLVGCAAVSGAVVRVAGVAACALSGAPLFCFVLSYLLGGIVEQVSLFIGAASVAAEHEANPFSGVTIGGLRRDCPGIWHYVWTSNVNLTLRMLSREVDLLVIGAMISPAGVGLFKIAKMLSQVFGRLLDPFYQAIFPELSRLHAAGRHGAFLGMIRGCSLLATAIAVAFWSAFVIVGRPLINAIYGVEFAGAYPVAVIYLSALVVAAAGFALQPAMLALGCPRRSFMAHVLSTAVYFTSLYPLLRAFDIEGAAWAYLVYYLVWTVVMIAGIIPLLRRKRFQEGSTA